MKHLTAINRKATIVQRVTSPELSGGPDLLGPADERRRACPADARPEIEERRREVVALQQQPQPPPGPHIPLGCSFVFAPGWEADSNGGTAGLCQPVERDLFDCHIGCFWPAQVPDQLNNAPDWTGKCAAAQKDWRKIDLVFPG